MVFSLKVGAVMCQLKETDCPSKQNRVITEEAIGSGGASARHLNNAASSDKMKYGYN